MTDPQQNQVNTKTSKPVWMVRSLALLALLFAYGFGAYSFQKSLFPMGVLVSLQSYMTDAAAQQKGQYDDFGRLVAIAGKQQVACPAQTEETAVLLVIGQSNSANHAEKKITTSYPDQVFNYYNGSCTVAASPLLGATGEGGEFITPLADRLIETGTYKSVVILASGISGSSIVRWQREGDLNQMLRDTIEAMQLYKVTDIVWHQGETDFGISMNSKIYEKSFLSLQETVRHAGIEAPIFIGQASKCGDNPTWRLDNPITRAQKALEDKKQIIVAVNTDDLLTAKDRMSDLCHFSESGQYKVAKAYAQAIQNHRLYLMD